MAIRYIEFRYKGSVFRVADGRLFLQTKKVKLGQHGIPEHCYVEVIEPSAEIWAVVHGLSKKKS